MGYWTKAEAVALEIVPELRRRAVKWWAARHWYTEAGLAALEVCGTHGRAERLLFCAAALSPQQRAGVDVANAYRAMSAFDVGGVDAVRSLKGLHPYAQQVEQAIRCLSRGEAPTGPKIRPFALALTGQVLWHPELWSGVWVPEAVVDRHMCKPYFGSDTPTTVQRRAVSLACMMVGMELGVESPAQAVLQAQASSWHEGACKGAEPSVELLNRSSYARAIRGLIGG